MPSTLARAAFPAIGRARPEHDSPLSQHAQRAALQAVGQQFHARGWSLATSSNYSAVIDRDPLRLLITASGKHKGELTLDDFVLVDQQGRAAEPHGSQSPHSSNHPGSQKPSAETLLHCVLAAHYPQIGSVLHTHSVWGTILSEYYAPAGQLTIRGYEMQKGLAGISTHDCDVTIRVYENTQDIPALARQLAAELAAGHLALRHGFLLRRHGLYTWGSDIDEARRHTETLEFLFEVEGRGKSEV